MGKPFVFLLFCITAAASARVQDVESGLSTEALLDLSFEDLLSISVSSTTKSSMRIQKAPGVVRVFTAEDIKKYHFHTLKEILMNIPGMQVNEYRAGHQMVWTRGVQGRYNNKTLLLIDGVPIRDSYYGHINLDEMLPLNQVENIEIINGPGSVLYGANAFASVIKITTKNKGRSARAAHAGQNSATGAVEADYKGAYAYLGYFQSDGFSPELNSRGKSWRHPQDNERSYLLLKHESGSLQAIASYTDYEYQERYKKAKSDYTLIRKPKYLSLRYAAETDGNGSLNAQAYLSHYTLKKEKHKYKSAGVLKWYREEFLDTYLFGADIDYSLRMDDHAFIMGVSYQQDQGDDIKQRELLPDLQEYEPSMLDGGVTRESTGIFLQDMWEVTPQVSLIAGMRYEFLSDFDDEISYRLGATAQFDDIYGKILYGTAFRIPSYREYLDIVAFNPELEPEHLNTFEVQLGYLFDKADVNLTFFLNSYKDFIGEINVDTISAPSGVRDIDNDEMAFNFADKTISGLELYGVFRPLNNLSLMAGASYILDATEELGDIDAGVKTTFEVDAGKTEISYLSDLTLNLAAAYTFNNKYTLGANLFYLSDRKKPGDYQKSAPVDVRDDRNADAYYLLDLFASINFTDNFTTRFKISNLFDEEIYSPPFGGAKYDLEWPGREYRVEVAYRF